MNMKTGGEEGTSIKYTYLDELEARSIYIIREACWNYKDKIAVLWSAGKDSTTLLHLMRKSFLGNLPIPVIHIDTTFKFKEIYKFRDRYSRKWSLKLIIARNDIALKEGMRPEKGRLECCQALKTQALKKLIMQYGFKALFVGIRRDEHNIRAKERYFSPRDIEFRWDYRHQPIEMWGELYQSKDKEEGCYRVHPLLHWREADIWRYIKKEKIPAVSLYFAKDGKRYRSIGCECCCVPINSHAFTIDKIIKELETAKTAERGGRAQDKEYVMQKLRSLGYM